MALTTLLTAELGQFNESHEERAKEAAQQMRAIREHVHAELATFAGKNFHAQERARQNKEASDQGMRYPLVVSEGMHQKLVEVVQRDDTKILRVTILELTERIVLLRVFHYLKCQLMVQKFDEQTQALRVTLSSNRELWERLVEVSQRAKVNGLNRCV